jgi:ABC-type transport system involved in multi-copper enzyme maturation permease subunit
MSSLARIWTIAANTVREAVRNKLLYVLLFFAILLILAGVLLSALSYVERERILQDIGLAAIRLFGVAIAVFVGVGLIHKEVDRRTVYTILSKPLSRAEFLLGKYVGLVLTIWMQMAIMIATFAAVSLATAAPLGEGHVAAFFLMAIELALVVALATLFSSFTTPMLASFFSAGLWFVGHLTRNLRDIGATSDLESVRRFTALLHRVLPDLESFNLSVEAAHQLPVSASDLWLPLLYGAGYIAILLVSSVALFERRDFR